MPYKVFVAGEEALASDANSYLMSQTVPRFTNATQRTAQLTAPVLGQLSMLDNRPGVVQYWTGSVWRDTAPLIQTGKTAVSTNTSGNASIAFPVTFGAAPIVVAMPAIAAELILNLNAPPTTSGFSFNVATRSAGTAINIGLEVAWIAVGQAA